VRKYRSNKTDHPDCSCEEALTDPFCKLHGWDAVEAAAELAKPPQSDLSNAADLAVEIWTADMDKAATHALRMAFFDGVQYGLRMAREAGRDER
jgi:hypothetical protein